MDINNQYRPNLHYTAKEGWINDPNGFSVYKNQYHLFAQHNPHGTKWGPMHWAHAVSDDLIKWEHKEIALKPEEEYEQDLGCFSGSAIEIDGEHVLVYTACEGKIGEPCKQTQCIAIGDGEKYAKPEQNPVIKEEDLPPFVTLSDFRDPKIFMHEDEYFVLLGAMVHGKNIGTMLLYKSKDLIKWHYVGETLRANEDGLMGIVFECPDIFKLGDKYVILTSPINMPTQGDKYSNVSSAVYFVGDMNFETGKFTPEFYDEIDTGFDFYAPQTLQDKNGERIMIAWAQMWERNFITDQLDHGWAGSMTIPRKLFLNDKKLYQKPVDTLKNYQKNKYDSIDKGSNSAFRLNMEVDLALGTFFETELLKTEAGSFKIIYDRIQNTLIIDRSQSMYRLDKHPKEANVKNRRKIKLEKYAKLNLDIIVDKSVIEIFINDGRHSMTSNYYTCNGHSINCINTDYKYKLVKYDL